MKKLPFLLVTLLALSFQALGQDAKQLPLITVSGQAEVRVPPDEVLFKLEVSSVDKDMLTAKKKTDDIVKEVFATAKKNKIDSDDVQTSYIVNGNNHVFSGVGTLLRIVGQSKKYESRGDVEKIKSFNEALTDVQKKEPKITALVPPWFQAARGPIIGWMVAHKGFKSGAKTRAHNHGILLSDAIDLAEIAALSRGLTEIAAPDQRSDELVERLERFLK